MPKYADRLIKALRKYEKRKVVDLAEFRTAKAEATALSEEATADELLAGLEPEHKLLATAHNLLTIQFEVLSELPEMHRFVDAYTSAEDEYRPQGPPMSPLTASYFHNWAFYDLAFGLRRESIASCVIAVGRAMRIDPPLLAAWTALERSRLGLYLHQGVDGNRVTLRELVTEVTWRCAVPAGYLGNEGELWLARVVPPPSGDTAVVFITPYLVVSPGDVEWLAYLDRTLPKVPGKKDRLGAYEHLMKYGLSQLYWNEYIFEAYANHRPDVIYLRGLPDVEEGRPHSRANSDRW